MPSRPRYDVVCHERRRRYHDGEISAEKRDTGRTRRHHAGLLGTGERSRTEARHPALGVRGRPAPYDEFRMITP